MGVQFDSEADFEGAQFHSNAYFLITQFDSAADFRRAQFDLVAIFDRTKINRIDFTGATLPKLLSFQGAAIQQEVDLSRATLDSGQTACTIDLRESTIAKFKLKYSQFQILLPPPDSLLSSRDYEDLSNVYEQLLLVQQKYGFTKSHEKLTKEYRAFQYRYDTNNQHLTTWLRNRLFNWLDKHWWDYGYNKSLIFRNTGLLFGVAVVLVYGLFPFFIERVYEIERIKARYDMLKGLPLLSWHRQWGMFSLSVFYAAFVFFGLRLEVGRMHFANLWGVGLLLGIYTVGLVCLAYLANAIVIG